MKEVHISWPLDTGLQQRLKNDGFSLRWVSRNNISKRELDGWKPCIEIDQNAKISRTLSLPDGSLLMMKKSEVME